MTTDEKLKAVVEVLKIVAWPAVVVWLVWYLRDEVKRAFARMTEVGLTGAKFAPPPPEQTPSLPTSISAATHMAGSGELAANVIVVHPGDQSASVSSGLQQFISEITAVVPKDQLDPGMQAVRSELTKLVGPNPTDQLEALHYYSAALSIQLAHERNYNVIFGSQLQLLAQMNVDAGVPQSVARAIYDTAKSANPEAYQAYTFEQWIGFLQGGLITVAPNGNYVLTKFGRGFLRYILDRRLSVNKPF